MRSPSRWRRGYAMLAALCLAAFALIAGPGPAYAAPTGRVLASPCLNQRVLPGGVLQQCIPANTTVTVLCVGYGPAVTGPYGTETIWDRVTYNGITGYVADAWVLTGSAQPVAARCPSREDLAIAWGNSKIGSQDYPMLCERFVENAYGVTGRYPSALADFTDQQTKGLIRTTLPAPRGALVYSRTPYDQGYGHVEISRGDGTYLSGGMGNPTVQLVSSPSARTGAGYTFLGWAYPPASWPGR